MATSGKSAKPTARNTSAPLRKVVKQSAPRAAIKTTKTSNTKAFKEWERTGKVNLDLVPGHMKTGSASSSPKKRGK